MARDFLGWVRENPDINTETKIILHVIFWGFPIVLFAFIWITSPSAAEAKKAQLIECSNETFSGRVDSLYFDKQNHNVKIAVFSNKYEFQMYRSWEPTIEIGDSLLKKKGSFKINIYKRNGVKIILDYKTEITD